MKENNKENSEETLIDDCTKPNNPEAQRPDDEDDACHEAVDGK